MIVSGQVTRFPVSAHHHCFLHTQGTVSGLTYPQQFPPKVVQVLWSQATTSIGMEEAVHSLRELWPGNRLWDCEGLPILEVEERVE